jgi:hypothetical protein
MLKHTHTHTISFYSVQTTARTHTHTHTHTHMNTKSVDVFIRATGLLKTKVTESCWSKTPSAKVYRHLHNKKHKLEMLVLNLNKEAPDTITDVKNVNTLS